MNRIVISWGIMTVVMALIHTAREFYAIRFLLGRLNSGILPRGYCLPDALVPIPRSRKDDRKVLRGESPFLRHRRAFGGLAPGDKLAGTNRLAMAVSS
jgi:hypothetical protein